MAKRFRAGTRVTSKASTTVHIVGSMAKSKRGMWTACGRYFTLSKRSTWYKADGRVTCRTCLKIVQTQTSKSKGKKKNVGKRC